MTAVAERWWFAFLLWASLGLVFLLGGIILVWFAMAHIVYWTFDRTEFVLRKPHVVGERDGQPVEVTDYSETVMMTASHEVWGELR